MAGFLPTLLFLSFLLFHLHSIPTVHSSDADTLRRLFSHLGIDTDTNYPCRTPGIACEINKDFLFVTRIRLPSRGLRSSIPAYISDLTKLRELSLHNNKLTGPLPTEISECRSLEVLNLRNNRLAGRVPDSLSSLTSLRALDLSSNKFTGDLSFLTHFPNLENLSLSDNLFSGRIPSSLSSFRNLVLLDLANNPDLSHENPPSLRRSLLPNRNNSSSNSTRRPSGMVFAPAPSPLPSLHEHKRKHRVKNWILGFSAGTIAGVVSGVMISVLFRMLFNCIRGRYRSIGGGPSIFSSIIKNADDLKFLEKDDVLAGLDVIGRGGCGEVFRAQLPSNPDKMIAIKKITKRSMDCAEPNEEEESRLLDKWMRQIRSEIQTVGHIRHRNLLPLLAHVTRPDCHFLIYEYMKSGSLHDVIKKSSDGGDTEVELDWIRRHKIALGIAAGLEYLHINHKPRIIHRDLKPANILLDDDMKARIADFGLAKEVPDANTHMTASNVAGTVGYIAPEYHQTLKFTTKCDIYSFGVILGVLVMGKFPSDDFFQDTDEMSLVKWLRNVMNSENPSVAIDRKLIGNGFEEQMLLVLKIACFCTADDPKDRPNSKDVRLMLSQIKHRGLEFA